MAWVQKALDRHTDQLCAIKRMKIGYDELLGKESFQRELSALQDLRHPNIVTMIDFGLDSQRRPYLVLEWIEENLADVVKSRLHPMSWPEYWSQLGRPILEAISVAQTKGYIHRDIKPKNILVAQGPQPKISDYGISRLGAYAENPAPGRPTFRNFSTKPYGAPEDEDAAPYSRDGFSWAVTTIYSLSCSEPPDYGEIPSCIDALPGAPHDILRVATAMSPKDRPATAALLLQLLDEWHEGQRLTTEPRLRCHLFADHQTVSYVANILGPEAQNPLAILLADFREVVSVRTIENEPSKLIVVGASWELLLVRDQSNAGRMIVERVRYVGGSIAERRREGGYAGDVELVTSHPENANKAEVDLDELFAQCAASEAERRARYQVDSDRLFRGWFAYLQAREEFERQAGNALHYSDAEISGRNVKVLISEAVTPELVGQERMIRVGVQHILLEVSSVIADEVTLTAILGNPANVPRTGVLEVSSIREQVAIERQRQALNAVAHDRCVNTGLRELLLRPAGAAEPLFERGICDTQPDFDSDKRQVLAKALGVRDVLVVEGPPGTGKTRLIEEIIVQQLERNPKERVLLSSQTHVALDNVIERVSKRNSQIDIVRVGRFDDPKIAQTSASLLLQRKAEHWGVRVSDRAKRWLEDWARVQGVDPSDVRAGITALSLAALLREKTRLIQALGEAEHRAGHAASETTSRMLNELPTGETQRREEQASLEAATRQRELETLAPREAEARNALKAFAGYRGELADSNDPEELTEYATMLIGDSDEHRRCLDLMHLQEAWLERVGKSPDFYPAMLASANVVAATCVGLASVRGINEVTFDLCIVDEASKAMATEILVPLSRSRRFILVGDPKQLPPFFEQELLRGSAVAEFSEQELRADVFDRFLARLPAASKARLKNQYRMARPIGDLVSSVFYAGDLHSPKERPGISFPSYPKLVTWLDTSGLADRGEEKIVSSFRNLVECRVIRKVLETLAFTASKRRAAKYEVAIIAGYQAQVKAIENAIRDQRMGWTALDIRVNTVDAFQGSQADICIYSIVRSNDAGKLGFLREPPRLNVALSRAKDLLIIVGDHDFCLTAAPAESLGDVIRYIDAHPADCEVRAADES